jgi:hypothetical protein
MGSKEHSLGERAFRAAYAETGNNGSVIDWRYWVHQLPRLTIAESARLICGLDPDKFKDLENKRNNKDQSLLFRKVEKIQRLAKLEGKEIATSSEWLAWAKERQFAIHDGFKLAVEVSPAPVVAASNGAALETREQRQDRRLQACEAAGLVMPKSSAGRLPDGVGKVADTEGVKRQPFSVDIKAALKRRERAKREGNVIHRA